MLYTITAEKLELLFNKSSQKKGLNPTALISSKDRSGPNNPIYAIYLDYRRGLKISKQLLELKEEEFKFAPFLETAGTPDSVEFIKFNDALQKFLPKINYDHLYAHYSQYPMMFAPTIIGDSLLRDIDPETSLIITQPQQGDISKKLILKKDQLYFETTVKRFPIKRTGPANVVDYFESSLNSTFKACPEGFKFQKLETDSDFIRDVFLHSDKVTPNRLKKELAYQLQQLFSPLIKNGRGYFNRQDNKIKNTIEIIASAIKKNEYPSENLNVEAAKEAIKEIVLNLPLIHTNDSKTKQFYKASLKFFSETSPAFIKELFAKELKNYVKQRQQEARYNINHHKTRFFGINFGYSAGDKTSAAEKLYKLLTEHDLNGNKISNSQKIDFSEKDLKALRDSTLGSIVKKYERLGCLPVLFTQQENKAHLNVYIRHHHSRY